MSFSQRINSRFFWVLGGIFLFALALSLGVARDGGTKVEKHLENSIDCEDTTWRESRFYSEDNFGCPDLVEVVVRPSFINENNSELVSRVVTLPSGKYGAAFSNSGYASTTFNLDVDGINLNRLVNYQGNTTQGVTNRSKMTTKNNLFYYPMDRYSGDMSFQVVDGLSKTTAPVIFRVFKDKIHGWNLNLDQNIDSGEQIANKVVFSEGISRLDWSLSRSGIVFFSVIILIGLMLIALFSVFFLTRSVLTGKRPPSMNLLLWISTILFAILQVRVSFPGNPPIGILLDYLIVFPVLSSLLFLGIVNIMSWLRRNDWDLENEPKVS
jgi:hypothetical protein